MVNIEHEDWWVNGARLSVASCGSGGPLVLLHGFPEFWYSWRRVMPALAERYRVIVPDLRGCGGSEVTDGGYELYNLSRDVAELLSRAGGGAPVALVGHDWGGVIGWHVAASYPSLVSSFTTVAGPHPGRHLELTRTSPRQFLMSLYILFFQLPYLPERLLAARRGAVLAASFESTALRPGAHTAADLEAYREQWSRVESVGAGLNYYRRLKVMAPGAEDYYASHRVGCPVLVVWGDGDRFLSLEQTRGLDRFCELAPRVRVLENCGHWVAQEAPEELAELVMDFVGGEFS